MPLFYGIISIRNHDFQPLQAMDGRSHPGTLRALRGSRLKPAGMTSFLTFGGDYVMASQGISIFVSLKQRPFYRVLIRLRQVRLIAA